MQREPSTVELIILDKLSRTIIPGTYMTAPMFADVATSMSDKAGWALKPLRSLAQRNLVEETPRRVGKSKTWRITLRGWEQALVHRDRLDPAMRPSHP